MAILIKSILGQMFALQDDWRFNLLSNWSTIMGPLHEQVRLERIAESTLIVGVYNPHWMQELFLLSRTLVRTINTHLGQQHVQKIQFKLVEKNQDIHSKSKKKLVQEVKSVRAITECEQVALQKIRDNELKLALKSFLERILSTN
jgi:hypothetical protein